MAKTLRLAGLAVVFSLSLMLPAVARAGEAPRAVWIVSTPASPMGTLTLRDGKLAFRTSTAADSWEIDLSDVRRVELSKTSADSIEIEDGWGNTYVIRILNARLTPESPSKAFKMIAGAMNESVKVMRVNGGQVR